MAGRLTKQKIDDLWHSGYCRVTVEHARKKTDDSPEGAAKRIEFLREHINVCQECRFANIMKNAEAEVAAEIGPAALSAFFKGEDVTRRPGYSPSLVGQAMERLAAQGVLTREFLDWMHRVARRGKYKPKHY